MNDASAGFSAGALSGCRVLELGSTVAGPFCGRLLGDFGAEVIKVEPMEGDSVRTMGKRFEGEPLYAASILRNKSLVCLDLRTEGGQAIVRKLVATGLDPAAIDRVKAPAGLDLGAITPEEIAMSILAEITIERRRGQRNTNPDPRS